MLFFLQPKYRFADSTYCRQCSGGKKDEKKSGREKSSHENFATVCVFEHGRGLCYKRTTDNNCNSMIF